MNEERSYSEEFRVTGEAVLTKIKELLHEGNIRSITIKNEEGKVLINVPLTLGVVARCCCPSWQPSARSRPLPPTARSWSSA